MKKLALCFYSSHVDTQQLMLSFSGHTIGLLIVAVIKALMKPHEPPDHTKSCILASAPWKKITSFLYDPPFNYYFAVGVGFPFCFLPPVTTLHFQYSDILNCQESMCKSSQTWLSKYWNNFLVFIFFALWVFAISLLPDSMFVFKRLQY